MKITLRQLEVFLLIAKYQNVSTAAEEICLSQAAASMSLGQLEHLLGQYLFDREGKRLILNNLGKQILPQVHELIQKAQDLERFIGKPTDFEGHLHIGASSTIANYILPPILNSFKKKYPKISIELTASNTEECIQSLANFSIDIGLVEGLSLHPKIEFKAWMTDKLSVFCHPKHPLAQKTAVKPIDLSDYPWILRERNSGTRQVVDAVLQENEILLNDLMICNSSESIKNIIQTHPLALSCLSDAVLQDAFKMKTLVKLKLKSWSLERQFYQIRHQSKANTTINQLFEDYLQIVNLGSSSV